MEDKDRQRKPIRICVAEPESRMKKKTKNAQPWRDGEEEDEEETLGDPDLDRVVYIHHHTSEIQP